MASAPRHFREPVGWLLDRQLINTLRETQVYSTLGGQMDPRNWMTAEELDLSSEANLEEDAFWFDYMADTGDSSRAMYSTAYLAYSDLWVRPHPQTGDGLTFKRSNNHTQRLPRGAFLFVGGDTAYHVADYETLAERFQSPFNWAFEDAYAERDPGARRPLLGIPANHDYYAFLDGFNRQFRRPFNDESAHERNTSSPEPQLAIGGFERLQQASYISVHMPFGWRLWGLDSQEGRMDRRQVAYFRKLAKEEGATDRLIVATPEPVTVFGRYRRPDADITKTLAALGLELPFLEDTPTPLAPSRARVDISGDVHHYARYWGSEPGAAAPANYVSLVAGGGGAFLHSSSTEVGEIPAEQRYPPPPTALAETLGRLLNPWLIGRGGYVWAAGAIVAGLIYLCLLCSPSIRQLFDASHPWPLNHVLPEPTGDFLGQVEGALKLRLPVAGHPRTDWVFSELWFLTPFWFVTAFASLWLMPRLEKQAKQDHQAEKRVRPFLCYRLPVLAAAGLGLFAMARIFSSGYENYDRLRPLSASIVVLLHLLLAGLVLRWNRQYDRAMFRQARLPERSSDRWIGWFPHFSRPLVRSLGEDLMLYLLWAMGVGLAFVGVWRYGIQPLAVIAADSLFSFVVVAFVLGLPAFAAVAGATLHGPLGRVAFGFLGLWHAFLQLVLPVLLLLWCHWLVAIGGSVLVAVFIWLFGRVSRLMVRGANRNNRFRVGWGLLAGWVSLVSALVYATYLLSDGWSTHPEQSTAAFFASMVVGAILSCSWFGWYLAVSLCFDGHNNEAGGGSRIDRFKHIVRFRLTRDRLTAFVIAIDEPVADETVQGNQLKPKLVDVFEIAAQPRG